MTENKSSHDLLVLFLIKYAIGSVVYKLPKEGIEELYFLLQKYGIVNNEKDKEGSKDNS